MSNTWGDSATFPPQPPPQAKHKYYTALPGGQKFQLDIAALKRDVKLDIATTIYGTTPPDYTLAIAQTIKMCLEIGLGWNWHVEKGNSDPALARNLVAANFLKGKFTHLMFLDADHWWYNDDILRMLAMDVPVLGMIYAKKALDWAEVEKAAIECEEGKRKARETKWDELGTTCSGVLMDGAKEHDGIVEAIRLPAGGMLIKREVFERIMEKRPDLKWNCGDGLPEDLAPFMWNFFQGGLDKERKAYFGEDYSFSNICRSLGIKIYGDMMARVVHFGTYGYTADPRRLIKPYLVESPPE